ncbi:MAG: hypothetical protein HUK22_07265 [Thermoguttaceae bacterium]|nr:hypothetical protein [Thermoguttaceae bacterium]
MTSFVELDYPLVRACLAGERFAWENFVDRFVGVVWRVVEHVAESRGLDPSEDERLDVCEAIFRAFRYNNYQLLREFAFRSAVSTYLVVVARRLAVALLSE